MAATEVASRKGITSRGSGYVRHVTTLRSKNVVGPVPAGPVVTPTREAARPARDPWFDNLKMTLVTLVVVGHSWTLLPDNTTNDWAYDFLYAWHIPAFVIITGYLSRSFTWTPAKLWALVRTVAVPYLVFEAALAWFRYQVGGVQLDDLFADPHWPMWYLSALFFWRLMTPIFTSLSRPVALGLAVVISLLAGLKRVDTLDSARILGLLPFFVARSGAVRPRMGLGAVAARGPARRGRIRRRRGVRPVTDDWIATEWILLPLPVRRTASRTSSTASIPGGPDPRRARRGRIVLRLVPRARSWFTTLGAATLVVYLFHGFFVLSAQYEGFPDWADRHVVWSFVVTTSSAVVLALLLAAPPVARILKILVDPIGWLGQRRRDLVGSGVS